MSELAHGEPVLPSSWLPALGRWPFEPLIFLALLVAISAYLVAARRLRAWPARRAACWIGGIVVVGVAVASPIASYDASLFWVHMMQHLLLTQVAAPLLVLGAPLALAVRTAPRVATERLSSLMRTGPLRALTHPLVAWSAFPLVMWMTHFSGLYEAALEQERLHALEHSLYLGAGVLFWWPVVAVDPGAAGRLPWPVRLAYVLVALPQQAFLGLAIYSAQTVLYRHYETVSRAWGPEPIQDQRIAGMIMWIAGDLLFLVALGFIAVAWMRSDIKEAARIDRRLDRMKA